jgi:hypothetical protein
LPATTGATGFAAFTSFGAGTASSGEDESDSSISESDSIAFLTAAFSSTFFSTFGAGFFYFS